MNHKHIELVEKWVPYLKDIVDEDTIRDGAILLERCEKDISSKKDYLKYVIDTFKHISISYPFGIDTSNSKTAYFLNYNSTSSVGGEVGLNLDNVEVPSEYAIGTYADICNESMILADSLTTSRRGGIKGITINDDEILRHFLEMIEDIARSTRTGPGNRMILPKRFVDEELNLHFNRGIAPFSDPDERFKFVKPFADLDDTLEKKVVIFYHERGKSFPVIRAMIRYIYEDGKIEYNTVRHPYANKYFRTIELELRSDKLNQFLKEN